MLFIPKNLPDTYSEWLELEGLADSFQPEHFEFESLPFHPEPEDRDSEDQTLETNDSESLPFHPEPEDHDSEETIEINDSMEMDDGDAEADSDINFIIFNDPPEVSTSPDPRRGGEDDGDGGERDEGDEDQSDDGEILRRLMNTPARVHLRALQELQWLEIPVQRALEYLADQESVPTSPIQSNNNSDDDSVDDVDDS